MPRGTLRGIWRIIAIFKAIITMMDVPTALGQITPRVRQISRGGALLIFSCLLLILGPLAYLWWRFDLSSTWSWFTWLIGDGTAARPRTAGAEQQLTRGQIDTRGQTP